MLLTVPLEHRRRREHEHGGREEGREESVQDSLHSICVPGVNITFKEIGRNLN